MKNTDQKNRLLSLIRMLQQQAEFDHDIKSFEILETHISYILLTGYFAYKFKKPLHLDFLDFSTLELRKFYCEEEIRLNRRLAPEIYIEVISITGTENKPVINGASEIIECAVKMVQFPSGRELDQLVHDGCLRTSDIDHLARKVAAFHQTVDVSTPSDRFGSIASIRKSVLDNFSLIRPVVDDDSHKDKLNLLENWTRESLEQFMMVFNDRKNNGYIRECHGDLHTGNIALIDDKPVIFDCIEFSEELRWIDIINEIAFLVMDLDARNHPEFAQRFLNLYLQINGDYKGLKLLQFYRVYRALVRCKVACIKYKQSFSDQSAAMHEHENYNHYLDLAYHYTQPVITPLIITHGLSASGKTTYSQNILEQLGAIQIRSDIERKRKNGMNEFTKSSSAVDTELYSLQNRLRIYEHLATLTETILDAGYPVIVDATFLERDQRVKFRNISSARELPFIILDFQAEESILRNRIIKRELTGTDASDANLDVLNYQKNSQELLQDDEITHRIIIDTSVTVNLQDIINQIKKKL